MNNTTPGKGIDAPVGGECEGGKSGSQVLSLSGGRINASVLRRKRPSPIDMFNKLAPLTAGVIVSRVLGSARHMVTNRHDIAAFPDLSIPSQWH